MLHSTAPHSTSLQIIGWKIQLAPFQRSAVCTVLYFLLVTTMSSTEFSTEVMAAVLDDE